MLQTDRDRARGAQRCANGNVPPGFVARRMDGGFKSMLRVVSRAIVVNYFQPREIAKIAVVGEERTIQQDGGGRDPGIGSA